MAKYKSLIGVVREGASNTFATLTSWRLSEEANEVDGTVIGAAAGSVEPGAITYRLEAEGFYDEADLGLAAVSAGDTGTTITIFERGIGAGLPQAIGVYNVLVLETSAESADYTRFSLRAASDGSAALDRTAQV